jgi:hypothetical protein
MRGRGRPPECLPPPEGRGLGLILLLAAASAASGGCGGAPQVPAGAMKVGEGREEKTTPLTMEKFGGFLGAGYLFNQAVQSPGGEERTEHLFQERAGLTAAGSVYSPAFLNYEATGVLGLAEAWSEANTGSGYDTGELYEGDVSAHLFPRRFHPANLYYTHYQDLQPQVFLSQLQNTTTIARAEQQLNASDFQMRFFAERREIEQKNFGASLEQPPFADIRQDMVGGSADLRLGPHQAVSGGYSYEEVKETEAKNDFTAHNMNGDHTLYLGAANEHQLRSRVEGRLQDGSLDQHLFRVEELFTSEITEDLRGDANVHYQKDDTNLVKNEEIRGGGGFAYQLFESLFPSLHFQGGHLVTDGVSTTDTLGTTIGVNYQKKNPIGVFRMSYTNFMERRSVTNDRGGAIDEPHTFPTVPPEEVRLFHPGIDPGSISVTNPTGLLFYRQDLDYTLSVDSGGFTTITRVFTGQIPIGGAILVDYTYELGGDYVLDTMLQNGHIEQEFLGGWTPYFSILHQEQHIVESSGNAVTPVRERGLIGGLELRRQEYTAGGEYENRESTILPFDAIRLRVRASFRPAERQTLTGNLNWSWLFYKEPRHELRIGQGNANWRVDVTRDLNFFLDGAVHYDNDTSAGESYGLAAGGGLEYRWRRLSMRIRAAHRESHSSSSDFRGEEVGVFIVREFGAPTPSLNYAEERFLRQ